MDPFDLARMDTAALCAAARAVRDAHWARVVTYSRKVFVPLTNMCRDTCGYCTFVKHPRDPAAQVMTPDEVRATLRAGEAAGCKEVLLSLGERPEARYPVARAALARLGHETMTGYLAEICALVLRESAMIPHVNAGTLTGEEIDVLRPVCGSMGMMLESTSRRLTRPGGAHHACPDKVPLQRLRTLERAGERAVPFTTGLLIGIGETWEERIETLLAIKESHLRHGHVQEVIVQNFRAKPGIAMADHPEPSLDDMLRTVAAARLILPPEVSVQAPPNLEARHIAYLDAGLNDWGGVSPVTRDFINPEAAWPEIRRLAASCAERGFDLAERLTVYPRHLADPARWIAAPLRPRLAGLAGSDGLVAARLQEAC